MQIHIVSPGETAASIAAVYSVSPMRLVYDNQLSEQNRLVPGQALLVLIPDTIHQVQANDTVFSVAQQYGISPGLLYRNNPFLIHQPYLLPGEYLVIRYEDNPDYMLESDGYAYPFINRPLLQETLPFLTLLSIFSYGFTPSGELIPIDDEPLLFEASRSGVKSVLVLTPFGETGTFNNQLVTLAVQNPVVQENLINNLERTAIEKGYAEVDVDFEYVLPGDSRAYAEFVSALRERMNALGITVSAALAPKTADDQPGLLYEGIDYRLLGEAADTVLLMTYEWGYTYGPPMAVAPVPSVRRVLDYAVTVIPPEKISMGIPNYGYDWPLPYARGETAARSIGNQEAAAIAAANNAVIQYDETAQAPFFEYRKDGISHIVWFEDVRSILAKFQLVKEYGFCRTYFEYKKERPIDFSTWRSLYFIYY